MSTLAGKFVGVLFCSRTLAHQLHLKTTSYAEHKALQEFYESIIDLADTFAEQYQGRFDEFLDIPMLTAKQEKDPVVYFQDTVEWIESNRTKIVPRTESALHNVIDEVVGLFQSTIYKLKRLK